MSSTNLQDISQCTDINLCSLPYKWTNRNSLRIKIPNYKSKNNKLIVYVTRAYSENSKTLLKTITETFIKGRIPHVQGLEDTILLRRHIPQIDPQILNNPFYSLGWLLCRN